MKICKNKGKTTIVVSRQGNMWHLRNGGDGEANASKAGMTKRRQTIAYGEQGETGPRNGGHLRKAPVAAAAGPATQRSAAAL